jgi:hypothetical protein
MTGNASLKKAILDPTRTLTVTRSSARSIPLGAVSTEILTNGNASTEPWEVPILLMRFCVAPDKCDRGECSDDSGVHRNHDAYLDGVQECHAPTGRTPEIPVAGWRRQTGKCKECLELKDVGIILKPVTNNTDTNGLTAARNSIRGSRKRDLSERTAITRSPRIVDRSG